VSKPLITVLVVTWNRRNDLLDALASVRAQTYRPLEMLVVDGGSTDGSVEAVAQALGEARIIRLDHNPGCPGGRNVGIEHATGDFIFFLDSDGVLESRAVEAAYRRACEQDGPVIVSARVNGQSASLTRRPWPFGFRHPGHDARTLLESFCGGASRHRSLLFSTIGRYPGDYIYGGEEEHLALRLLERGHLIAYEPDSMVLHREAQTGRAVAENLERRWEYHLATVWDLYPLEMALWATVRSLVAQPIRAIEGRVFLRWVRSIPRRVLRVLRVVRRGRHPVRRSTVRFYHLLQRREVVGMSSVRGGPAGSWFQGLADLFMPLG
jgi:GT2 family glycosyltransferase